MTEYGIGITVFDMVFPNLVAGENQVICPFHDDKDPSMSINTTGRVFHCHGCGVGGTEHDFTSRYYAINHSQASALKGALLKSESLLDYDAFARTGDIYKKNFTYNALIDMGIERKLLESCMVGCEVVPVHDADGAVTMGPDETSSRLVFPIICRDRVLDLRAYSTKEIPKTKSKSGAPSGLILPYHLWEHDMKPTVICEGEKDMLFARQYGYNAISVGGCKCVPNMFMDKFKDRTVFIVFDNDLPGRTGAMKLASALYNVTKHVHIANIGDYVAEEKEDVTDFFVKYKHTRVQFDEMLGNAKLFDSYAKDRFLKESYPETSLLEASTTHLGKMVRTNIQVMATFEEQYSVPGYATFTKMKNGTKLEANRQHTGAVEYWSLQKHNFSDVLVLTDNNLKQFQINENLKEIIGWMGEEFVKIQTSNPKTIFKASVSDSTESVVAKDIKRTEFICFTDEKLEAGKNYQIIYKVVPHPYKGQQQVLMVSEIKESGDVVTSFEITMDAIKELQEFQKHKFPAIVNKQKSLIKFNVDNKLLTFIDLWYHTPKSFNFGYMKEQRGYLDGLIVTESRVGKSTTAQALSKVYGLGAIASLAGSAATPAGLIGGSVKTGTSSQIRPGLIPRQHNKAVIFEELAKAKYSLMPELTDIRSSGMVRINRSTGDLTLPASVRILFLTNPKAEDEGIVRPIMAYPNGVEIIKPLIGSVEDIARFDFIYILGESPTDIDPLWEPPEGFTEKQLQTRIRWVWSRKTDNIIISKDIEKYVVEVSKNLNNLYLGSVKIFSTETWKKLIRLAIAIAGYTVSADLSYENIIVKKEHIDYAANLLRVIYDNSIFKLKEFIDEERKQTICNLQDINEVMSLLNRFASLIEYLENNNNVSKNTLLTISGLDNLTFGNVIQTLSSSNFVTLTQNKIFPTPKFLIAIKKARDIIKKDGGVIAGAEVL